MSKEGGSSKLKRSYFTEILRLEQTYAVYSYIFIFLFLPLCLGGFYLFSHWGKSVPARLWLTGFSLWFYGYFNPSYLLIMACSILFNYAVFRGMQLVEKKCPGWRRPMMILGVAGNLAVLFYFKYYDFFVENVNAVFGTSFVLKGILLPLGISFFTFQQIGFVVDAYRGEVKNCTFLDYALFVSFFPQLIAGPIVSQSEMLPQFAQIGKKKADPEKFAAGIYLFTLGMVKKVLVADTFGLAVDWGYSNIPALSSVDSLLLIFFYSIQLYFDFSGYCDMARGLAWMFGMEIPVNFNSPYKAVNIIEFWRRWHITLSRFFPPVCIHSPRREPEGQTPHVREPDPHFPAERHLARRRLDLCDLGSSTGHPLYHHPCLAALPQGSSEACFCPGGRNTVYLLLLQLRLRFFPVRDHGPGLCRIPQTVYRRHCPSVRILYRRL